MKKILILFSVLLFMFQAKASDALQDSIAKANKSYLEKDYKAAIKTYNNVISLGYASAELYYNTGNAYYKAGKITLAIVNYEKALKIDPSFSDAAYNREMANKLIIDKIEAIPEFFLTSWFKSLVSMFSYNYWAYLSVSFFALSLILLSIYFYSSKLILRKIAFFSSLLFFVFVVFTFWFASKQFKYQTVNRTAIIYETVANVKSSPSEDGTDIFPLHEGTKVEMLEEVGEWTEIRIADGKQGWLKKETLIEI